MTTPRASLSACTPAGASYAAISSPWAFPAPPSVDLPAPAAPAGSEAPCGDCPSPALGRLGTDAALSGLPVHGGRAGGAPHCGRRGAPAWAVRPLRGRACGAGRGVPVAGQERDPHGGTAGPADGRG